MTQRQCRISHGWQLTELGTWSTVRSPRAAQQIGECLFQVSHWSDLFQAAGLLLVTFATFLLLESSLHFSFLPSEGVGDSFFIAYE